MAENEAENEVVDKDHFNFSEPTVTIPSEDADTVDVYVKLRGLKPNSSVQSTWQKCCRKQITNPQQLMKNATFDDWSLTEKSLFFVLRIKAEGSTKRNPGVGAVASGETYRFKINQMPTEIKPDMSKFDVRQTRTGSFLVLKLVKASRGSWAETLRQNGNLDCDPDQEPVPEN